MDKQRLMELAGVETSNQQLNENTDQTMQIIDMIEQMVNQQIEQDKDLDEEDSHEIASDILNAIQKGLADRQVIM